VFTTEILGLWLNPAQMRWFRYIQPDAPGWQWRYRRVIHVAANQIGKTLGVAILILWGCIYKIGLDPSLPEWFTKPYLWIHLAPTQPQAYHALNDIRMLMRGAHPAQQKSGLPFRLPAGLVTETKISLHDGLEFASGAVAQFRTSDLKAAAIQGYRADAISVDEAAFETYLKVIVNETLMMRLIASEGPMFLVSTPDGMNDYYELVQEVRDRHHQPEELVWTDEERRWAVTWSVIQDNVGFGVTQGYVDAMEDSINADTKEQQLRGAFLTPSEAFFVPQDKIIAALGVGEGPLARQAQKLPMEQFPAYGHRYVIFWDPSADGGDPTAVVVLDITRIPWTGVYFKHYPRAMDTTEMLNQMVMLHNRYNNLIDPTRLREATRAVTGFDATSLGGRMWADLLRSVRPSRGFNFGGPDKKLKALIELRTRLGRGEILIPPAWQQLRHEVMSYRLKDDRLKQDSVMALTGAVAIASAGMNAGARPFDVHARVTPIGLPR
jgi:hypothetical protein